MPTIENIAAIDFKTGQHKASGDKTIAIQIVDPCGWIPVPMKSFAEIHRFEFLDITDPFDIVYGDFAITVKQAESLCDILSRALASNMNIVVHCTAGICRSGAVTEVGSIMGFDVIHNRRIPNILVKTRMLRHLGLTYEDVSEYTSGSDITKAMEGMKWN